METFPSDLELTAVSALLLLSTSISLPTTTTTTTTTTTNSLLKLQDDSVVVFERKLSEKSEEVGANSLSKLKDDSVIFFERISSEESEKVETIIYEKSSDTTPCRSSLTSDHSVSTHRSMLMASAVAQYREMKVKIARRARSKVIYRGYNNGHKLAPKNWATPQANKQKMASNSQAVTEGTTTTETSCLSSGGTSDISSARNRGKVAGAVVVEQKRRRGTGPSYISRRAEAILRLLSCKGCASEVRIRQLLGDSPDTSKALRMLVFGTFFQSLY
ncbi:hypothetical protein SOVF_153140 [Spinacia oleracea]|nr:hypothetical protein SOVF_153140 [Spinacia oleracea]